MNILVTGSAGYIGPVVVAALRREGHTVLGYDVEWFAEGQGARVVGDIRERIVGQLWPKVVVHLAGISNDPMGDIDPDLTLRINAHGTTRLALYHGRAHHVVISSCSVYGQADGVSTEETPVNPQTTYARAKAEVDEFLLDDPMGDLLDKTILRLGTVFGPAPNHRLDLVVNRMVFDGLHEGVVHAYGNAARPLVHVDDVAAAVVWAVEHRPQGIYNIVGENVRIADLAQDITRELGASLDLRTVEYDTRDYMASGTKALAAGWAPTRSVLGSLPALVERTKAIKPHDLHDHVRLAQLRRLIDQRLLDPQTLRRAA